MLDYRMMSLGRKGDGPQLPPTLSGQAQIEHGTEPIRHTKHNCLLLFLARLRLNTGPSPSDTQIYAYIHVCV